MALRRRATRRTTGNPFNPEDWEPRTSPNIAVRHGAGLIRCALSEPNGTLLTLMPSGPDGRGPGGEPASDAVLTIKEVPTLLKLAEKTVCAMENSGELPAFRVRGQWWIRRTERERWMEEQPRGGGDADA